jgi:hypothetical protein
MDPFDASFYGLTMKEAATVDTHEKLWRYASAGIDNIVSQGDDTDALEQHLAPYWVEAGVALRCIVRTCLKDEAAGFRALVENPAQFGRLKRGIERGRGILIVVDHGAALKVCVYASAQLQRFAMSLGLLEETHPTLAKNLVAQELAAVEGPFLPNGIPRARFDRRPYDRLSHKQRMRLRAVNCLKEWGPPVLPHLRWRLSEEPPS